MTTLNPFILSYLTEGSLTPQELLQRYSFAPLRYLNQNLASGNNVFLIGRPGVGKTMLLKIFTPEMMSQIYESTNAEHARIRDLLPLGTVGVYLNLATPDSRLDQFQGRSYADNWWLQAYADYLNTFLFDQTCYAIEAMFEVTEWCKRNQVKTTKPLERADLCKLLLQNLRKESSSFEPLQSFDEIRLFFRQRLQQWSRFTNSDDESAAPKFLFPRLGRPLFHLVSAMRECDLLATPFRLFVIVDQYENLYDSKDIIDYRPIFNEAIRAASRGGTGVEFKIGSRQWVYKQFELPAKSGKIEIGREAIEINLDEVAKNFYKRLAKDIFQKRLSQVLSVTRASDLDPKRYLPELRAIEEAQLYVGEGSTVTKHISPFQSRWRGYGFKVHECEAIVASARLTEANVLVGTLACIAITRWLRGGMKGQPVGCSPIEDELSRPEKAASYLKVLIKKIQQEVIPNTRGEPKALTKENRAIANFVHDAKVPALFQLASYYKNLRRYYSGFETIARLSSNVAVVLIELLQAIYDRALLSGNDLSNKVSPKLQSEAIYRVSANRFERISREFDYGETHREILKRLGAVLRSLQIELTAPHPSPNRFSVDAVQIEKTIPGQATPRNDARVWLNEAVSWGLLERYEHEDKGRGRPKRVKYCLNRILCPYFGLSEVWQKDPPYVNDINAFFKALSDGKVPTEFSDLLTRSEAQPAKLKQGRLLP
jgi:hypothetical protein